IKSTPLINDNNKNIPHLLFINVEKNKLLCFCALYIYRRIDCCWLEPRQPDGCKSGRGAEYELSE
ncbi:hypothetical protein ACS0LD_003789, partial [Escherichia coli]